MAAKGSIRAKTYLYSEHICMLKEDTVQLDIKDKGKVEVSMAQS